MTNSQREVDLVLDALAEMSSWGSPPSDQFLGHFLSKHSNTSEGALTEAVAQATKVQELVRSSSQLYKEPYDTIHDKIQTHIRSGAPGLTDAVYFLAEHRCMQMYIR